MRPLILHKKTGFRNLKTSEPVVIRDFRGVIFYDTNGIGKVEKFNLPAGNYFIDKGFIKPMRFPRCYKLSKLPEPERSLPNPKFFSVLFGNNPNKCSISWPNRRILFDNSLKSYTLPELYFILFHEFGHQLYGTEKYADLFSANMMKRRGFNPSQCGESIITSLSKKQKARKKFLTKKIIKDNGKKKF
jgi:hypothetical protein